ncbi:MAG: SMC-Scp complex subunit ScpB [Planctomycetaceae bacterium]|jgi:segregation and condensation protein B|nr:SMC-Scp complex subunit ScpB [Planctomycetaceae bacterium]
MSKKSPQQNDVLTSSDPQPLAEETLTRIEAVLFLSREPVSGRRLVQLADIPEGTRIRGLVKKLNSRYDSRSSAFRIYEVAGGFQIRTRPHFVPWLARLHSSPIEIRLSTSALETLTIIAHKQPVLRATVEKIRGVQCGEILRQLMEQDLVKITGKTNDLGRPFLYGTTKRFFQLFGINRIEEISSENIEKPIK